MIKEYKVYINHKILNKLHNKIYKITIIMFIIINKLNKFNKFN